jgi:hypothetical protein
MPTAACLRSCAIRPNPALLASIDVAERFARDSVGDSAASASGAKRYSRIRASIAGPQL